MASRHHSLQLTECADVMDTLLGFQEHNNVRIVIELTVLTLGHVPSMQVVAQAWETTGLNAARAPLASVECDTRTMNLRNLRDAVTHALYALDFKLALRELDGLDKRP